VRMNLLKVLSRAEIKGIHEESLRILGETGVAVFDPNMLGLISRGGAEVDLEKRTARFPESLIGEALGSCPKTYIAQDRDGDKTFEVGGNNICVASGFYASYVLKEGRAVPGTVEDVATFARISDCLDNMDAVGVEVLPQDVPAHVSELCACRAMLNNTTKHLLFSPNSRLAAKGLLEMIRAVADEEDLSEARSATFQSSSTSPLAWDADSVGVLAEASKAGLACNILPEPMAGATSPVTLAAVLLVHNAEFLSGLVMSQLVRKGSPVIYGYSPTIFDMRKASPIIASPETLALRVAHAQMGRFYGLPVHCIAPDSDAQCHDEQMAWEKVMTFFAALNSGANIIMNCGMFSTGLMASYEQLVIDDEIVGYLLRALRGIQVNAETLAAELVQKVGPRGHFVNQIHTVKHARTEYWLPELSNRETFGNWLRTGRKDIVEKARHRVKRLLKEHRVPELGVEKMRQIEGIVEKHGRMEA